MPDLQTEVSDPKTKVSDLGSGGIRLDFNEYFTSRLIVPYAAGSKML